MLQELFLEVRGSLMFVLTEMSDKQRHIFYKNTNVDDDSIHDFIKLVDEVIGYTMQKRTDKIIHTFKKYNLVYDALTEFLSESNEDRNVYEIAKKLKDQGEVLLRTIEYASQGASAA